MADLDFQWTRGNFRYLSEFESYWSWLAKNLAGNGKQRQLRAVWLIYLLILTSWISCSSYRLCAFSWEPWHDDLCIALTCTLSECATVQWCGYHHERNSNRYCNYDFKNRAKQNYLNLNFIEGRVSIQIACQPMIYDLPACAPPLAFLFVCLSCCVDVRDKILALVIRLLAQKVCLFVPWPSVVLHLIIFRRLNPKHDCRRWSTL